jgi:hypothetical protein
MNFVGIARWMREIPIAPPSDPAERPHVVQHLFKVTHPMEWVDYVAYRHGKLIKDPPHGMPNRMRVEARRMEKARLEGRHWSPYDNPKPKPRYFYGRRTHHTAFVIASASDLRTYMNAANVRMLEIMKARGDKEGERLFSRQDHFEVETFLFPCDKFGNWKDGGELRGSQKGTLDHRVPFRDVGYLVVGMPRNFTLLGASVDIDIGDGLPVSKELQIDTGSGFQVAKEAE